MTTRKTFRIANMECVACAMRLESLEDVLPGVQTINASYRKARMDVEFDERSITEAEIIAAVKKIGYQALPD